MRSTLRRAAAGTSLVVLAAVGLTGCGDDDNDVAVESAASPTPEVKNEVTITGIDYGYTLDKPAVDSGTTKITFVNGGKDAHMLAMGQIATGKTLQDVQAALQSEDEKDDATVLVGYDEDASEPYGVPQVLTAGARTATYPELKPGSYALICYFPTPDGKPHFAAGMLNELKVNDTATAAPLPTTTGEITLADGKITLPDLSLGKGTFKVTNTGKEGHDFTIVAVAPGKTFDQTLASVDAYFQGKAKVDAIGGVFRGGIVGLPSGSSGFLEIDLEPGSYFGICTQGDGDMKEHFRAGTEKVEFTVV